MLFVFMYTSEIFRQVYGANSFSLGQLVHRLDQVLLLLKRILYTAGRKQIPEDCVEIVTLPPCPALTHRFQTLLRKEGNVSRLPRRYCCNFRLAGMSSVLLGPLIPVKLGNSKRLVELHAPLFTPTKKSCYWKVPVRSLCLQQMIQKNKKYM